MQIAGRGEVGEGYHGYASPIQPARVFQEVRHFHAKQCVGKDAYCYMLNDSTHIDYVVYRSNNSKKTCDDLNLSPGNNFDQSGASSCVNRKSVLSFIVSAPV